jgi:hypothetical protein
MVDSKVYNVNMTMSILSTSVKEAAYFARKLSQACKQSSLGSLMVQVQMPESLKVGEGGACTSHYSCTAGLFCSAQKVCKTCRFCQIDKFDAVDGTCPQDLCPKSGGFPECVDGAKLVQELATCQSSYPFSVWCYNEPGLAPEVQPQAKPRSKYITPYNCLVGALMVTQRRTKKANCSVGNALIQKYLDSSGASCQSTDNVDSSPFSLDPTFLKFSRVYDGKLSAESVYFDDERANDIDRSPFAFFEHAHDIRAVVSHRKQTGETKLRKLDVTYKTETNHRKDPKFTHEASRGLFKLYFDETLTGKQSDKMLAFMRDGKFIDSRLVHWCCVHCITTNCVHSHLAIFAQETKCVNIDKILQSLPKKQNVSVSQYTCAYQRIWIPI